MMERGAQHGARWSPPSCCGKTSRPRFFVYCTILVAVMRTTTDPSSRSRGISLDERAVNTRVTRAG